MTRSLIAISAVLVLLLVACGSVFAVDRGSRDRIADGVRVGGVAVGGLRPAEAEARVRDEYVADLREPVVVTRGERRWTLSADRARVAVDTGAAVDEALAASRAGNPFSRVARDLTGGTVSRDVEPQATYSRKAVSSFVARIAGDVDSEARDASVELEGTRIAYRPSVTGRAVQRKTLTTRIRKAMLRTGASRRFRVPTQERTPSVTSAAVKKKYATVLVADRKSFKLTLYKDMKVATTYGISVGKEGNDTPPGQYAIQNKQVDPVWNVPDSDWAGSLAGTTVPGGAANNPLKARWLGVNGAVGIHGTSDEGSIGTAASHGCLRMRVADVKALFPRVPVGAPVWIV